MYQRYYKQRKFGKLFSLFLVIGSGISHYLRTLFKNGKKIFDYKYLSKYDTYLPEKFNHTLDHFNTNNNKSYLKFHNLDQNNNDHNLNTNENEVLNNRNTNIYQFYSMPFKNEEKMKLNLRHRTYRLILDFRDKII